MGFSVSGAAAIIFASLFVAFGMWYTAAADGFEQVTEAQTASTDGALEQQNTRIEIASASYAGGDLTVEVNNTGAAQLSLSGTDLLVDGRYVDGWQGNATVEGNAATDLWLAGETLSITVARPTQPDRVKIVAGGGVADTAVVS